MSLLIVAPIEHEPSFRRILDREARYDWEERPDIKLVNLEGLGESPVARGLTLRAMSKAAGVGSVLVPARFHCNEEELKEAGLLVFDAWSLRRLLEGRQLEKVLKELKLDWRFAVETSLQHFGLGPIGNSDIEQWLQQFDRLGVSRRIGQHLLQLVEVMPTSAIADSLRLESGLQGRSALLGVSEKLGKSGASISILARKSNQGAEVLSYSEAIARSVAALEDESVPLHFIEDGLFTGTETIGVLDSLLGRRPPGNSLKASPLQDPSLLSKVELRLRYSVTCDFGLTVVEAYARGLGLTNLLVDPNSAARQFSVIGSEQPVVADRATLRELRDDLATRVQPYAFQSHRKWPSALRDQAEQFCRHVGGQLWKGYIERRPGFDPKKWSAQRLDQCALGMYGLGLCFAFPHSVPRASLPLFWARGRVDFATRPPIDWVPLFPSADDW